ncbi:MAG: copper resistance protein NlpE [Parafilimonas sp.]
MQGKTNQFELMKSLYAILFLFFIASCNLTPSPIAATDSAYKTVVPETPFINAENYVGTLPCADCEGIDVSLQLNHNSDYIMNSVYKGSRVDSSNNHFIDSGKWSLHGSDTLILSGKNHSTKYIKTESTLTQLDGSGKLITGPLAKMFVLHKK